MPVDAASSSHASFLHDLAEADAWLYLLTEAELEALLDFCDLLLFSVPDVAASRQAYVELLGDADCSARAKVWAGMLNLHARWASGSAEPVLRSYGRRSLGTGRRKLQAALERLRGRDDAAPEQVPPVAYPEPEAPADAPEAAVLAELDDREFVLRVHEAVLGRGCRPSVLRAALAELRQGNLARDELLRRALDERRTREVVEAERRNGPGGDFHVMGTGQHVTRDDWAARARELSANPAAASAVPAADRTHRRPRGLGRPLVSVLTSLYRGRVHLERFLANMVEQTCFGEDVEVLVVDAASPEGEAEVVERWARQHPSIRLLRCSETIGVYAAWNRALAEARGDYVTNANVDDLRREDSLELQADALSRWPEIDIVYQDFYYTMDPTLSYAEVAAFGYRSRLPDEVDPEILMGLNPPHHAPMWRARLHRDLGPFDDSFRSAGDYEFWVRCLAAGRRFRKIDDPHAVYYQNPTGVSTRPDTRGHHETRRVLRRHGRRLLAVDDALSSARLSRELRHP